MPPLPSAQRVPVLMYHRVGPVESPAERLYCVEPARFAAQMNHLAAHRMRAVSIEAFVDWLHGGPPLPAGAFVLTFDDGFLGVRTHALPVLERLGWPFAVFLVTDLLGGVDTWRRNDGTGGGRYPLLAAGDIAAMCADGCSFHSHTRRHPSLPALDDAALADELAGSRAALADLLGHAPDLLAYPYGHADARVEAAARHAGYRAAFSVRPGFNRPGIDPMRIRRIDVFGTDTPGALLRKLRLGTNDGRITAMWGYFLRRIGRAIAHGGRRSGES